MQDGRYHKIKLTDLIENCPSCGGAPIRWSGIRNKRQSMTAATLKCNRQGRGRCDYLNACRRAADRRRAEQLALALVPRKPARTNYRNIVPFVNVMNAGLLKRASSGPYANDRLTVLLTPSRGGERTGIDAIADAQSKECDIYKLAAAAAAVASAASSAVETVGAWKTASSDVKTIGVVKTASSAAKTEAAAATAVETGAASAANVTAVETGAASAATTVETGAASKTASSAVKTKAAATTAVETVPW